MPANTDNPIENTINNVINKFDEEKEKKSNKKALAVGASVILVSSIAAILNPRYSSKFMNKLKTWQHKSSVKINKSKDNYLKSKFHKACFKMFKWGEKAMMFSNNFNTGKDVLFKWFCTEEKKFFNIKNTETRNRLRKWNSSFIKIAKKPYNGITKIFDKISRGTVKGKYRSSNVKLEELETLIAQYKGKLSNQDKRILETKLEEINRIKKYYSDSQNSQRLNHQEK